MELLLSGGEGRKAFSGYLSLLSRPQEGKRSGIPACRAADKKLFTAGIKICNNTCSFSEQLRTTISGISRFCPPSVWLSWVQPCTLFNISSLTTQARPRLQLLSCAVFACACMKWFETISYFCLSGITSFFLFFFFSPFSQCDTKRKKKNSRSVISPAQHLSQIALSFLIKPCLPQLS